MLNKETQKKLLQLLGASEEDITTIIDAAEEKDFTIPDGIKVFNAEDYATLEANMKNSGKTSHINAGKEIAIKDLKEKLGIEYDGKDPDLFIQKAKEKIISDAKIAPNEAKQQWEQEKKTLQEKIEDYKGKYEAETRAKSELARDTEWLKKFPAKRSDNMSDEDRLLLIKNKLQAVEEDGKVVYQYKGKRLQDDKLNDFDVEAAIAHVFNEEKWIGSEPDPAQGRGLHSQRNLNAAKPIKLSEAKSNWEKEGKTAEGHEFQAHVLSLVKENKSFDMNN